MEKVLKALLDQNFKDLAKVEVMGQFFQQCRNLDPIWIWLI